MTGELAEAVPIVVDASVAAKWFLPEAGADAALGLLDGRSSLLAPDLLWAELASILWKTQRRGLLSPEEALSVIDAALGFPIETHTTSELVKAALTLAMETGATPYDALYLALAERESGVCITADAELAELTRGSRWSNRVRLLTAQAEGA